MQCQAESLTYVGVRRYGETLGQVGFKPQFLGPFEEFGSPVSYPEMRQRRQLRDSAEAGLLADRLDR